MYLYSVSEPHVIDNCLLYGLFIARLFATPIKNKKNNTFKLICTIYLFILAWSGVMNGYQTSIQRGMLAYFGLFAPSLDIYLYVTRNLNNKMQNSNPQDLKNLGNDMLKEIINSAALILLVALLMGVFTVMSPDFSKETQEEQNQQEIVDTEQEKFIEEKTFEEEPQEVIPANETHNGIAFDVTSTKYVDEAYLRGFGILSMGDSPVVVVTVRVKNNGKEPYNPNIKARLIDENGAIYAGNIYSNIYTVLNSAQNILNPGTEKTEILYFKIPEKKDFTIEFQDGTFFSDTVSIKLQ